MDAVYNSPPNWPTPPAGWRPPPGWTADPSWPEAPPGWQFWVPAPNAPPARKKHSLWLMIGVPVGVVGLIIVLGITAMVVFLGRAVGPAEAASSYAQALKDQRYEAAYAMTCPELAGDHDDFVAFWTNNAATGHGLTAFKIVGANVESVNGHTIGKVKLEVQYADGTKKLEQMTLAKTGETWKTCNL
jgi:hypothetical protein